MIKKKERCALRQTMGESAHINGLASSLSDVLAYAVIVAAVLCAIATYAFCSLCSWMCRRVMLMLQRRATRAARRKWEAMVAALPLRLASVDDTSSECCVCLERFCVGQEIRTLLCLHEFHRQCVDAWLLQLHEKWPLLTKDAPSCPLCKTSIETLRVPSGCTIPSQGGSTFRRRTAASAEHEGS